MPELISFEMAVEQGLPRYFTGSPCTRGHIAERQTKNKTCVVCRELNRKKRRQANPEQAREEWRVTYHRNKEKHAEKNRARAAQWRADNPELFKEQMAFYAKRDSEARVAKAAAWAAANPEKMREHRIAWKKANPDAVVAADAKRRALEKNAMPKWLTKQHLRDIQAIYAESRRLSEETGVPHHVDHIVPLVSKKVCGLHVPWNLKPIPAPENYRKSNKHQ